MKKLIPLLVFFSLTITCMAQSITLNGASPNGSSYEYNGVYNLSQTNPPFFSGKDSGTNVYAKSNTNQIYSYHYIFRSNNYWYIANDWDANLGYYGSQIAYRWNTFSNSIDPPCLADWEKYTAPVYTVPFTPTPITPEMPSGNFETLAINGNCFDTTSCNTSFLAAPQYIQMPTIPNQDINSISPPHKSMMTYDCELGKLMLHDGTEWIMVQGSKKDVILPNAANVVFDNGYNISQASTDGLNINKANNQIITLNTTGYNKVGINNSTPSSAVHLTGSNAYSVSTTSSDLTLNQNHRYVIVTGTVSRTMTLPDPSTCPGRIYSIANYTTQSVDVTSTTNSIQMTAANQFTTFPLASDYVLILISNGTKWYRMGT
ncbi:hypothetical protein [Arcticibacterium luteifluviistationis]|uniref:Uncharacterized protein n=1 Tax=Arcticibacterium luteifluviistationis TaxID=1784714 RepID=A0A2Z4GHD0_9BACT|nr:hypothetical protein [Arcticibacterium luteifluviistationis]AWW00478.1 hypothetical protein DJ013_20765 [Arcticibacterium luteifluviistationis]